MSLFSRPWTVRHLVTVGVVVFVVSVSALMLLGRLGPSSALNVDRDHVSGPPPPTLGEVIQHGQERWTALRAAGTELADGPCLDDGETYPGWAIDLVREARIDVLPENQCATFLSGKSTRLIELSLTGDVVRVVPEGLWDSGTISVP